MPRIPSAVMALALAPALLSAAGPQRRWDYANYCQLRIVPAEQGAPANGQPLQAEPAVLAQALGAVQ